MGWIGSNSLAVRGIHVPHRHFLVLLSLRFLLVMFWYLCGWWYDLWIVSWFIQICTLWVSVSFGIYEIVQKLVWYGPDVPFLCMILSGCRPCSFLQTLPGNNANPNGAMFHLNLPKCVKNMLFFAVSGDNLSPWNAPVQSRVIRNLQPRIDASISSVHGSGYGALIPCFSILQPSLS